MASISPAFILDDAEKNRSAFNAGKMAFHVALFSTVGGSGNPLLMTDKEDAKTRPVLFGVAANS